MVRPRRYRSLVRLEKDQCPVIDDKALAGIRPAVAEVVTLCDALFFGAGRADRNSIIHRKALLSELVLAIDKFKKNVFTLPSREDIWTVTSLTELRKFRAVTSKTGASK